MFNFSPYSGLLNQDEQSSARNNLLMNFGLGLLANSGPSPTPTSFGQAFGRAGLSAMDQNNQFAQQLVQNRFTKQKMGEIERQGRLPGLIGTAASPVPMGPPTAQGQYGTTIQEGTGLLGGKIPASAVYQEMLGMGPEYAKMGMVGLGVGKDQGRGEYFQPVQTADGVMAFDARRGVLVDPITQQRITGKPVIGSSSDPTLQGRISRSKEFGQVAGQVEAQSTIKKPQQAKELLSILDQADGLINKSTGSLAGTGVDIVAGAFGHATEGSKANASLKVLQAGLMSNMPRMEGPQSDRDVQLYRESAGQIGDPTIPNEIKKAAIDTIRKLNEKYAARGDILEAPSNQNKSTWEDGSYMYRRLPDGTVQRKKK